MRNGEVVIIDEFTGRMMPGRRYSEGLHQALEAKEHQPIQPENQTLASITFQNYFRMYEKLAGMTGTAMTEADEFIDIYNLEVLEVPTNMPMIRLDDDDEVYRTAAEKYRSIIIQIAKCHMRDQPILVGTVSIEKSETLSEQLKDVPLIKQIGKDLLADAAALTAEADKLAAKQSDPSPKQREQIQELRAQAAEAKELGDLAFGTARGRGPDPAPDPQRPLPRAGGLHHRPGRRSRHGDDRDQHGRPRHRHPARRQRRHARPPGA